MENKEANWSKWLELRDRPISDFTHRALRSLTQDQRREFKNKLREIIILVRLTFYLTSGEHPSDDRIRRDYESIRTHLFALERLFKKADTFLMDVLESPKLSIDKEVHIHALPQTLATMRRLTEAILKMKVYRRGGELTKLRISHIASTGKLLIEYGITPTLTTTGAWHAVTRYILRHGFFHDETDANIKNLLGKARFFLTQKSAPK
jgi:hypothetical protein